MPESEVKFIKSLYVCAKDKGERSAQQAILEHLTSYTRDGEIEELKDKVETLSLLVARLCQMLLDNCALCGEDIINLTDGRYELAPTSDEPLST